MEKVMFVAFSHNLTEEQIQDAKASLGVTRIVALKEVNPELQNLFSQIPAAASLQEVQEIADRVVNEAREAGAEVFFCAGEPTLMMWANLFASQALEKAAEQASLNCVARHKSMECVQSTTERISEEVHQPDGSVKKVQIFKHVAWRNLF